MTAGGLTLFFFAAALMIASASSVFPQDTSHRGDSGMYLSREVEEGHIDKNHHGLFFWFGIRKNILSNNLFLEYIIKSLFVFHLPPKRYIE